MATVKKVLDSYGFVGNERTRGVRRLASQLLIAEDFAVKMMRLYPSAHEMHEMIERETRLLRAQLAVLAPNRKTPVAP